MSNSQGVVKPLVGQGSCGVVSQTTLSYGALSDASTRTSADHTSQQSLMLDVSEPHLRHDAERHRREGAAQGKQGKRSGRRDRRLGAPTFLMTGDDIG